MADRTRLVGHDRPLTVGEEAFRHPAWPALSFIDGWNVTAALRLIAEIEDPRWHVGLEAPDSDELLYTRFGLNERNGERNMAAAIAGDVSHGAARYDCALMALDASAAGLGRKAPQHREVLQLLEPRGHVRAIRDATVLKDANVLGDWQRHIAKRRQSHSGSRPLCPTRA